MRASEGAMDVVEVLATYGGDAGTGDAAGTANEVDVGGAAMVGPALYC